MNFNQINLSKLTYYKQKRMVKFGLLLIDHIQKAVLSAVLVYTRYVSLYQLFVYANKQLI